MARGGRESWGYPCSILAPCCTAGADTLDLGHNDLALWQLVRSPCYCLRPDGRPFYTSYSSYRSANLRRCPAQPRARLCSGDGDGDHHGIFHLYLFLPPAPLRKMAEMTASPVSASIKVKTPVATKRIGSWLIFLVVSLYFLIPLGA